MLNYEALKEKMVLIGYDGTRPKDKLMVEAMTAIAITLDNYDLSDEQKGVVLDLLSTHGQDKLNQLPDIQEDSWEEFNYGNVKPGHFVRVKRDAYDSDTGEVHNGLVGILRYMSAGRCLVDYIGLSAGKGMRHPMEKLESLKLGVK